MIGTNDDAPADPADAVNNPPPPNSTATTAPIAAHRECLPPAPAAPLASPRRCSSVEGCTNAFMTPPATLAFTATVHPAVSDVQEAKVTGNTHPS
ncbi:MAG: hypothetical protein WCC60_11605 [Ilumatobacteraceae bacterium]